MEFEIACGTWIKENDKKVLNALKESDKMLSIEELKEITGLPEHKINRTLHLLAQQIQIVESRKRLTSHHS